MPARHLPPRAFSWPAADAIKNLKSYVESRASRRIEIVAKARAPRAVAAAARCSRRWLLLLRGTPHCMPVHG